MTKKKEYRELILDHTVPITQIEDNLIEPFRMLSYLIYDGKINLKINTVDFIIAKLIGRDNRIYRFNKKDSFDVYVLGTFRTYFSPTFNVAKTFANFYLEHGIMPNIISVPKHILMNNTKTYVNKIRGGVLVYERR